MDIFTEEVLTQVPSVKYLAYSVPTGQTATYKSTYLLTSLQLEIGFTTLAMLTNSNVHTAPTHNGQGHNSKICVKYSCSSFINGIEKSRLLYNTIIVNFFVFLQLCVNTATQLKRLKEISSSVIICISIVFN